MRGVLAVVVALVARGDDELAPFTRRNKAQVATWARAAQKAPDLSEGATQHVLSLIDSIRGSLPCGALSAEELLARFEAETSVAELTHNLNASGVGPGTEVSVSVLESTEFLPTDWAMLYVGNKRCFDKDWIYEVENSGETEIYGFPAWEKTCPANSSQAAERPAYTALNTLRYDVGNPVFGDVSLVLDRRLPVILSPADTGYIEMTCRYDTMPSSYVKNCSAQIEPGTLSHFRHLLAASVNLFNSTKWLKTQLARSVPECEEQGFLGDFETSTYWEAVVAAPVVYSRHVRFVVAAFQALFGDDDDGARLVAWAAQHRLALVWAHSDQQAGLFVLARLLDPLSADFLLPNVSAPLAAGLDARRDTWRAAAALRANATATDRDWLALFEAFRAGLPPLASVRTLFAGACEDPARCFLATTPPARPWPPTDRDPPLLDDDTPAYLRRRRDEPPASCICYRDDRAEAAAW